jgi:hypothetical protein
MTSAKAVGGPVVKGTYSIRFLHILLLCTFLLLVDILPLYRMAFHRSVEPARLIGMCPKKVLTSLQVRP